MSNTTTTLRRAINVEIKMVDAAKGIVDYIASDETLDYYNEIIRADGWKFTKFARNAPFVDSHDYSSITKQVGRVVDFRVEGKQLIERVQWAKDVPENQLAQLGWKMTEAGFLKAVSVGFQPVRFVTHWDADPTGWREQLAQVGKHEEDGVRVIYVTQEQLELSAVIIGANPNALAKAYKAGALSDSDLEKISEENALRRTAYATVDPAIVALARQRDQDAFLGELTKQVKSF